MIIFSVLRQKSFTNIIKVQVQINYYGIFAITRVLFISNEKADPHNDVDQDENIMQGRQQVPGDRNTLGEAG